MRGRCRCRRILQILIACPSIPCRSPDPIVKTSSKNPLPTDFVHERITNFGTPRSAVNDLIADDTGEVDGAVKHFVAASWTTSPKDEQSIVKNREVREVRRPKVISWFIHCLTNWSRPMKSVVSGGEPHISRLIAVEIGRKPSKVELSFIFLENRSLNGGIVAAQMDWVGFPVARAISALVPDSGVGGFALPGDVEITSETGDRRRLITFGASALVGREVILLERVCGRVIGRTDAEKDAVARGAIGQPELTMPVLEQSQFQHTRKPTQEQWGFPISHYYGF